MSIRVLNEVIERSAAREAPFVVLLMLAEAAHHDGVTWIPMGPESDRKSLAFRSRLSTRTVERAVWDLEWNLEVEIRKAQRGRRRVNVYRVTVGDLAHVGVDYDRLPFELAVPFASRAELGELRTTRHLVGWSSRPRPDTLSGGQADDDPTSATATTRHGVADGPTSCRGPSYAEDPSLEPSGDPPCTSPSEKPPEGEVPAAAGASGGSTELKDLVAAFAGALGVRFDRQQWGQASKAFQAMAANGVRPDELALRCRAYRERWPHLDTVSPMGLTKCWAIVGASLEQSYFGLHRWVTQSSWRLPVDEADWILEQSARLTEEERARLLTLAADVRAAHSDPTAELLRWVELQGFALDDPEWRTELSRRLPGGTAQPEARRRATELRLDLRQALAQLQFGTEANVA